MLFEGSSLIIKDINHLIRIIKFDYKKNTYLIGFMNPININMIIINIKYFMQLMNWNHQKYQSFETKYQA